MKRYAVGTVCTLKGLVDMARYNGTECTIIGAFGTRDSIDFNLNAYTWECYAVSVRGETKEWHVAHENLEPRKPRQRENSWATEKVKQIFTPNPKLVEETA
jgi:hypothetical protein